MNRPLVATALASFVLAACSSGGSDSDAPNPFATPAPPTTAAVPMITRPTTAAVGMPTVTGRPTVNQPIVVAPPREDDPLVVPPPVSPPLGELPPILVDPPPAVDMPPVDPPIVAEPPPVVAPPTDIEPPTLVDPPPVEMPPVTTTPPSGSLDALYGRADFQWRFDGTQTIFTASVNYSQTDLRDDVLTSTAQLGAEGADGPVSGGTAPMACLITDASLFLCNLLVGESMTLFVFSEPVTGESAGAFEFCPAGTPVSDCVSGLIGAPDGLVLVTVEPTLTTRPSNDESLVDLSPYYAYAAQGVPAPIERSRTVTSTDMDMFTAAVEALADR